MPEFSFSAKDQAGNFVEGRLQASDISSAAEQLRGMGHTPIGVQLISTSASEYAPTLPTAAPDPRLPLNAPASAPMSLTQKMEPTPQAVVPWQSQGSIPARPLVPLGEAHDTGNQTQRLEPWQRGGPTPEPPRNLAEPTQSLDNPTQFLPRPVPLPQFNHLEVAPRANGRPVEIPYSPTTKPNRTVWQRFLETMIYPVYAGVVFKEMPPFFRQFSTLISAGIPLYQALAALEANTKNGKLKEICREGQKQVLAGGKFSDVMAAYPWIFQPVQIELVRASEQGGMLDRVLVQLAEYSEHELEIRRIIRRETFYPKAVLFVALMIFGSSIVGSGEMAIVRLVLGDLSGMGYLANTLGFGLVMLFPILALVAICRLFLFNVSGVQEIYDRIKLTLPGIGKVVRLFALARFTRTFAALYKGGFSVGTCLQLSGDASGNAVIARAAHRAIATAEQGGLASQALATSGAFPPMALDMLRTGEMTGNMDTMLDKVGDYFEDEGKLKAHQAAILFGVIVFLIVALLVATKVIQFYTGFGASRTTLPDG
jgi:type II secretory pathway component PulF